MKLVVLYIKYVFTPFQIVLYVYFRVSHTFVGAFRLVIMYEIFFHFMHFYCSIFHFDIY